MMKPIDRVNDLICILSDTRLASINERQLKQEESCWAGVEHVRRLDVKPEDRSTVRQKALCHEFRHRAQKSGHCTKEIGVTEVNMPIGQKDIKKDDAPMDWTKR